MAMHRATSLLSLGTSKNAMDALPIGEKATVKRNISKHLNNNSKAGYVPVGPKQTIAKTCLRGRKTFAFWTLVCLLFILAVGNLILTFTILGVLRLGQGMESLELVPEASVIKFFGMTDLDRIYKRDGKIEGFFGAPVQITGDNGSFLVNLLNKNGRSFTKLKMDHNGTIFEGLEHFNIIDAQSGEIVFSTESPTFELPQGVNNLNVMLTNTNRITSPVDRDLHLRSEKMAYLQGTEGTHMEGKEIVWFADQDIFLKSDNGSVVLSAKEGIFIDMKSIPVASDIHSTVWTTSKTDGQFKVCVCMPQGKLFRVPISNGHNAKVSCAHVNMAPTHNPCM